MDKLRQAAQQALEEWKGKTAMRWDNTIAKLRGEK
jgi:hypothetical protein